MKVEMLLKSTLTLILVHCVYSIKIGIIGGGIGGTSAAYFLRQLAKNDIEIDLYEKSKIGGRLATVIIDEDEYEIGGSIIHEKNKYTQDLMKAMNLSKGEDHNDILGLLGDKGFEFIGSKYSLLNIVKLYWRYGWEIIKLDRYISDLLSHFARIYSHQEKFAAYESPAELLSSMNPKFVQYLQTTTFDGFKKEGFSEKIIEEIVFAALRCNYGQTTHVHQFVGAVSVAGSGAELFSIKGGNRLLPKKLAKASNINTFFDTVIQVTKKSHKQYLITTSLNRSKEYDVVIVATPMTKDMATQIKLIIDNPKPIPGSYHKTVCIIVKGELNKEYFGFPQVSDIPDAIITTSENYFFNSLSKIYPVSGKTKSKKQVWKIFSQDLLSDKQLKKLFKNYIIIDTTEWLAYPHYNSENRNDTFVIDDNLYYINSIEWVASAIEMSVIGAKNVVLLILDKTPDLRKSKSNFHEEL